jgi:hypothetical protein
MGLLNHYNTFVFDYLPEELQDLPGVVLEGSGVDWLVGFDGEEAEQAYFGAEDVLLDQSKLRSGQYLSQMMSSLRILRSLG